MTTALKTGQEVWIEYSKGILEKVEDGKYHVRIERDDGYEIKVVHYKPKIDDFEPAPFYKNEHGKIYVYEGKKTCWMRDEFLCMYYYMLIPSDTFKGYDYMSQKELEKMTEIENPYWDEDRVEEALYEIDKKIRPLREQVNKLEEQIREFEREKSPIQARCCHEWEKTDEEDCGDNWLGRETKTTYYCNKCEQEKVGYSTSLG